YSIKDGDVIVNPIGGTHQLLNTGDREMLLIVIETPIAP
ncbi:MAG: cupin protein, partial [Daejeonella sp.]|nr:cupin protein [Daejeonella sp.]